MSTSIYTLYWIHLPEHTDPLSEGYVGITSRTVKKRFQEHKVKRDLPDDCLIDTLCVGDKSQILQLENKHRPEPNIGWNVRSGGHHGARHSDETKERWSDIRKGRPSHRKGKTLSEEHKLNISKSAKNQPSHRKGKTLSEEHRRKMSEAQRRRHGLTT